MLWLSPLCWSLPLELQKLLVDVAAAAQLAAAQAMLATAVAATRAPLLAAPLLATHAAPAALLLAAHVETAVAIAAAAVLLPAVLQWVAAHVPVEHQFHTLLHTTLQLQKPLQLAQLPK